MKTANSPGFTVLSSHGRSMNPMSFPASNGKSGRVGSSSATPNVSAAERGAWTSMYLPWASRRWGPGTTAFRSTSCTIANTAAFSPGAPPSSS